MGWGGVGGGGEVCPRKAPHRTLLGYSYTHTPQSHKH